MTNGTDLRIDLEAALGRGEIETAEGAGKTPVLRGWRGYVLRPGGYREGAGEHHGPDIATEPAHHAFPMGLAVAPDGRGPRPVMTGRLILSGNGSGRSSLPRMGRITRKCR